MTLPPFDCRSNSQLHVLAISFVIILSAVHFGIIQTDFEGKELFVNIGLIASITATLFVLAMIFRKYVGAKNIRISYMYLLISYVSYLQGELTWFVYESVLGLDPYPSIADVGFFFYYVFTAIFLVSTIRCFSTLTLYDIGHALIIMSIIASVYIVLSIDTEIDTYDLLYGLPFILAASSVFVFSIIALFKLRKTSLALPWIIIFASMVITTVADLWYYPLENIGGYTYDHIINTMWIASDAVLVYALVVHRRII
jgi:hypothetical protein